MQSAEEKGRDGANRETALRFLAMGLSLADVAKGTELSLKEVELFKSH